MRQQLLAAFALLATAAAPSPEIHTEDVASFYRVYDAAKGHPDAATLDRDYLAPGSVSLHEFAKLRNVTGARIAANIEAHPEIYEKARACLALLPRVTTRLQAALGKLKTLYPEAKSAPVAIVVGRGRPVGITSPSGVTMGLEALCTEQTMDPDLVDRFVHTIAHEYGHIQQSDALQALEPGRPGATVLVMSLGEGVAEFAGELISGGVGNYQHQFWTRGHEREIAEAFLRDKDKTDLSAWLYNGPGTAAKPSDLGYWVGYRIARRYYERAADKHQALRDIFEMKDPQAFLAKSGWSPANP